MSGSMLNLWSKKTDRTLRIAFQTDNLASHQVRLLINPSVDACAAFTDELSRAPRTR